MELFPIIIDIADLKPITDGGDHIFANTEVNHRIGSIEIAFLHNKIISFLEP